MSTRLFVGRLSTDARDSDLEKAFREFGEIKDVIVKQGYGFVEFMDARDAEDAMRGMNGRDLLGSSIAVEFSRSRRDDRGGHGRRDDDRGGYGRRDDDRGYYDRRDADRGHGGSRRDDDYRRRDRSPPRRRSRSRSRDRRPRDDDRPRRFDRPRSTKFRLTIDGLPDGVNWQDLKDFFRSAGEVTYADVDRYQRDRGVVDFASHDDMQNALKKLDGEELRGARIRLSEDRDRMGGDQPARARSRSRGRSTSPTR